MDMLWSFRKTLRRIDVEARTTMLMTDRSDSGAGYSVENSGWNCPMSIIAPTAEFASLDIGEAMTVCADLPPGLLLWRETSTPADRALRAKDRAFFYALAGFPLALLVMYLVHRAGDGWALIAATATATLSGSAIWGYWRVTRDAEQVFNREE
jgi:hypothetical protein